MRWNTKHNARMMPWKGEKDPYRIWLSEIILQQTRVEQGLNYYQRFIDKYPRVEMLAAADENELFKLWEGLGYYSRCKNLIASARHISFELNNRFPDTHENILTLKGVGPYTAAAIASFAYGLPHAVVDGNVLRVLARFFGIDKPIDGTEGKKYFSALAESLLHKASPASYNQAIMDFGATVCKPQNPFCDLCVLQKECAALKKGLINMLPVKEKKLAKKNRFFYYVIAEYNGNIYLRKREAKDIWQNLWEFILFEQRSKVSVEEFLGSNEFSNFFGAGYTVNRISSFRRQQLTHQTIDAVFIEITLATALKNETYSAVKKSAVKKMAFPRLITNYFEDRQGAGKLK